MLQSPFSIFIKSLEKLEFTKDTNLQNLQLRSSYSPYQQNKFGVLLHRRFSNLPLDLIGPLHKNLKEDIDWILSDQTELDESIIKTFANIQNLIILATCKVLGDNKSDKSKILKDVREGRGVNLINSPSIISFDYFEDEIFLSEASEATLIKNNASSDNFDCIAIMVLSINKLKDCIRSIDKLSCSD